MGNHYSYTARLSSDELPAWTWALPNRWIAVAGAAVIETAHLGVKTVAAPVLMLTPYSNSNVREQVSLTEGETATHIRIVASWLGDGSWTGPVSSITGTLTGAPLAHWFAVIETNRPNVYYWAELNNHKKTLKKCSSIEEAKRQGANSGGNENAQNFTVKMSKNCYRSMSSVREWVESSSNYYNATLHNCQIWAENLYDWI